jgi:PAS domain S-box-containing protein
MRFAMSRSPHQATPSASSALPDAVFRSIADHAVDLIYCKDRDGRYTYVNEAVGQFFGKPTTELIGKLPGDVFEPVTAKLVADGDRRTLAGEEIRSIRELTIGGEPCMIHVIQTPLHNDAGEVVGLSGIARNLTVDHLLGSALIDSERRGKALLDASPVPMMMLSDSGIIEYLNPAFTATLGYTLKDISDIEGWWRRALPNREERERLSRSLADAIRIGAPALLGEWKALAADGTDRILATAYSRVGAKGLLTLQDQTGLIRLARHAHAQESLLQHITDSARDAIFTKDCELRYTFVNPAIAMLLGLPVEYLLGRKTDELFSPEDAAAIATVDRQALAGKITETIHDLTVQDHRRTFHTVRTPIRDDAGTIIGICGIVRDVTVQRRIDRMLNLTQFTVDHVATVVLWLNRQGQLIHANRAACDLLGYSLDELLKRRAEHIFPAMDAAAWPIHWALLQQQKTLRLETDLADKAGARIPVESAINYLEYDGRSFACHLITDLHGRREAEAEFRRLGTAVEQAAESIMITSIDGAVTYVNPAFTRLTGYARDEIIGHNARILNSGRQGPEVYQDLWRTIGAGETWRGHLVNRKKDGSLYEEEAVISPVRDPQGNTISYVAVKRDVTREMAMEQQLRQSQKMEAVGNLAGGVAHDFNNLIMVISNCAKFARDSLPGDAPAIADLDQVIEAGRRAATLTRQLLAFSRRQTLARETEDLGRIIRELEKMLRRLLRENIAFNIHLPVGDCPVKVDVGQIEQVLVNIVVNASDAMPGGGTLTIAAEANVPMDDAHRDLLAELPGHPEARFARLRIVDTGTGMSPAIAAHIFEPFFTTKGVLGTGLGLATACGIIRQHEGAIGVVTQPGKGSEFFIYLPMDTGDTSLAAAAAKTPLPHGRESILLVEDNALVRKITRRILTEAGYQVMESDNGRNALALLEKGEHRFDLLITDVIMPEMDGISLAVKTQELFPGTGVIFISGYPLAALSAHGLRCAPENLLQKPFSPQELGMRVRTVLDRQH